MPVRPACPLLDNEQVRAHTGVPFNASRLAPCLLFSTNGICGLGHVQRAQPVTLWLVFMPRFQNAGPVALPIIFRGDALNQTITTLPITVLGQVEYGGAAV